MIFKLYKHFINESAFNDIEYNVNGMPAFNTSDQITIDFTHMIDAYFNNEIGLLKERLDLFNSYYNTNLDFNKHQEVISLIEEHWGSEDGEYMDLTLDIISHIWNNPKKMESIISSHDTIKKFNL
jgi:hypothetical protein